MLSSWKCFPGKEILWKKKIKILTYFVIWTDLSTYLQIACLNASYEQ